jgi:hypothetical protein
MNQRQISALHAKHTDKNREILKWVVKSFGLGDVSTFKPNRRRRFSGEFDDFLGNLFEWFGPEDWRVIDERVARTDIGRLVQQRHDIAKELHNLETAREQKQAIRSR